MFPPIYATLKNWPAVFAIVGERIGAHGEVPQDTTRPYVTWQLISGTPDNCLADTPPNERDTVQVNCLHQTDAGVRALALAVRNALESIGHVTGIPVDQRDPETRLYWVALQADIFEMR